MPDPDNFSVDDVLGLINHSRHQLKILLFSILRMHWWETSNRSCRGLRTKKQKNETERRN
jgi:hypothetical protein